jgi:AraC family transcriptional regulator
MQRKGLLISSRRIAQNMRPKCIFSSEETHGVLRRFEANVAASSERLGWSSAYASIQRERPFEGRFTAMSDHLMVLHRSGPVDVTFQVDGQAVQRQMPLGGALGGIFFLPAGHECDVTLHAPLDTIHVYLRADLFGDRNLELGPLLGVQDPILQHLASAMGEALTENIAAPSLFVDSIAQGIACRLIAIREQGIPKSDRRYRLSERQLCRIREFVDANLETDLRLESMARACGLSIKTFLRSFKASFGTSPHQYVIAVRVERAKRLLEEQSLGLAEIALHCGFSHQEHLTRMFRRLVGQTPARYRRLAN